MLPVQAPTLLPLLCSDVALGKSTLPFITHHYPQPLLPPSCGATLQGIQNPPTPQHTHTLGGYVVDWLLSEIWATSNVLLE